MDSILVINAGSSSVKFQVFAIDGQRRPRPSDQGPGRRHRNESQAARQCGRWLRPDRQELSPPMRSPTFQPHSRSPATGCVANAQLALIGGRASRRAWRPTVRPAGSDRRRGAGATSNAWSRWRHCTSRTISHRSAPFSPAPPSCRRSRASTRRFTGSRCAGGPLRDPGTFSRRGRAALRLPRPVLRVHRRAGCRRSRPRSRPAG